MKCPNCGKNQTEVLDSRATEEYIRRRRKCLACDHRFTTYERAGLDMRELQEIRDELKRTLRDNCADLIEQALKRVGY